MKHLALITLLLFACGDKDDDSAAGVEGACPSLCVDAGFSGGTETDYGDNLIECQCDGAGGAVTQAACTDYCDDFGVSSDRAYLTSEYNPDDKCVCDGTGG